eukprot:4094026-Pyramimonas_sp.AAC.1
MACPAKDADASALRAGHPLAVLELLIIAGESRQLREARQAARPAQEEDYQVCLSNSVRPVDAARPAAA